MASTKSVRTSFMGISILSITLLLAVFGFWQYASRQTELTKRLDESLKATVNRLSQTLPAAIWSFDDASAKSIILSEMEEPAILGAAIIMAGQNKTVFVSQIKKGSEFVSFDPEKTPMTNRETEKQTPLVKDGQTIATLLIRYTTEFISKELFNTILTIIIQILIMDIVVSLVNLILITRIVIAPMKKGIDFAKQIAEGNLCVNLEIEREDEIGQLAASLKNMLTQLTYIVQEVHSASAQVSSGSQILSGNAQQMAQSATEEASSIEEISSSMEQMTSSIRQNADNALQTEKIAKKSSQEAEEGGLAVLATVSAMKEIASKIGIIEEIARSTNMLALNASIEAARAGEFGKGFAVVASEVGKLAERSQKEAGVISKLSKESVVIAEKAGASISEMIPNIKRTAELVQEISAASNEQNSGAEQINIAITQLDSIVQQNAASAEESASMAEELASQSAQTQSVMEFFKIDDRERIAAISQD